MNFLACMAGYKRLDDSEEYVDIFLWKVLMFSMYPTSNVDLNYDMNDIFYLSNENAQYQNYWQ